MGADGRERRASDGARVGRPENPVDPDAGPVERLAWELRRLRAGAGGLSYRALAKKSHYSVSTLAAATKGDRLPSLEVLLAFAEACGGKRAEWEARWRAATAASEKRAGEEPAVRCPYPGLAAFRAEDAEVFFGRTELVKELSSSVERNPLTAVFGASGSGKSSLLRAGLLPELGPLWHTVTLTPGAHPLAALAHAVGRVIDAQDGDGPTAPGATAGAVALSGLAQEPERLELALSTWLTGRPEEQRVLMAIDQFEEAFTLCNDEAERAVFHSALVELAEARSPRLRLVIGVRDDFYGRCFAHRGLRAALQGGAQLPVGPPSRAELREIIVEPAARAGSTVAPELVATVIAEAADQPGALPLVAHALRETWHHRHGPVLRLDDYRATGGMRGAVAQTAEAAYTAESPARQALMRAVFLRLTTFGDGVEDTRRHVPRTELDGLASPSEVDAVLGRLTDARLVVLSRGSVEVAHEAVIRVWPRLRRWLDEDREALRTHRRLTAAAQTWDELDQDPGALYRGTRLSTAEEAFAGTDARSDLTTLERDFLTASTTVRDHERHAAARTTRRLRQFTGTLSILLVLALTAGVIAWDQYRTSEQQRHTAVTAQQAAQSRALAARAVQLSEERPEAAMVLALKGYRQAPTTEARNSLLSTYGRYYANQLTGHTETVESAAFAPDGRTLATASFDHSVKLWDTRSHQLLATLTGHTDAVNTVAYSPDGDTLATASNDRSIKLWDTRSHRLLATLTGHTNMVEGVAYSPDGHTLASASSDHTVRLWDVRTHRERAVLTGHTDAVMRLAFSPDGRMLASADYRRTTRLWDVSSHKTLAVLAGRTGAIFTVAFSPDGHTLATAGNDRSVKLWDVHSRRLLATLTGHTRDVYQVAFSPDGHTLASASLDGTIRQWRPRTHKALATLTTKQPVFAVAFSPNGRTLASTYGRTLASTGQDPTVRLWNVASRRPVATMPGRSGTITSQASFADRHAFLTVDYDNSVARWSTATPRTRPSPIRPPKPVTASVADSDGHVLATADGDRTIRVWNLVTGRLTATLTGATGTVQQLAITPDGSTLAAASNDGTIRVWRITTRRTTAVLRAARPVNALALRPDGHAVAFSSTGGTTRLWTIRSGQAAPPLPGPKDTNIALAFSPDGRTLAVGGTDGTIRVWDVATCRTTVTFTSHTGIVRAVAFSPDGSTLATTSTDRNVRLWNTHTARLRATLSGANAPLSMAHFSPDGHALATFGPPKAARVWSTDANYVATRLCRLITDHHWAQLLPEQPVKDLCEE